ncbi:hypothetical protein Ciccas_009317 [Cichlidogyrus casuarinus]|uniref:14-3-3 domain-containing protein n=1 Tax=Cichlidogyrus casuarinus TaxID=1844966 RepID=A0ABD2PY27_9PLAT
MAETKEDVKVKLKTVRRLEKETLREYLQLEKPSAQAELQEVEYLPHGAERLRQRHLARCAEQVHFFDDMCDHMKVIVKLNLPLTLEERNLLVFAYKNLIDKYRVVLARLKFQMDKDKQADQLPHDYHQASESYHYAIWGRMKAICMEMIEICEKHSIYDSTEGQVFFLKTKADFLRYLCEVDTDEEQIHKNARESVYCYVKAKALAEEELRPSHPVRLGVATNLSKFWFEVVDDFHQASIVAFNAFKEAVADFSNLEFHHAVNTLHILKILRNNILLWTRDPLELAQENSQERKKKKRASATAPKKKQMQTKTKLKESSKFFQLARKRIERQELRAKEQGGADEDDEWEDVVEEVKKKDLR